MQQNHIKIWHSELKSSVDDQKILKMFSRIFTSCLVSLIVALVYGGFSIEHVGAAKITIEQMQQTTEPVKLVCMQKTKVPEDLVLALKKGDISDKKELKCYLNCVFEMMQVVSWQLSS